MDRRGQTPNQRHPQTRHNQFPRIQSRREHQSLPATSTRPPQQAQRQVRRRQKPKEFSGEVLAPPEYPTEHAQRGGHIPGAVNIPWSQAVREDGTFKPYEDIKKLYETQGVTGDKDIVAYCRIGERSSFSWFVLKYLLGYPNVRNYDGSWTEWGNLVRNPIEKPAPAVAQTVTA